MKTLCLFTMLCTLVQIEQRNNGLDLTLLKAFPNHRKHLFPASLRSTENKIFSAILQSLFSLYACYLCGIGALETSKKASLHACCCQSPNLKPHRKEDDLGC